MTNKQLADLLNEHEGAKRALAKLNELAAAIGMPDDVYKAMKENIALKVLASDPALFKKYSDQLAAELYDEINAAK